MIEYYDFTKGGMQQIPGFETLGSKLLGQANPFWESTENRAAKETTKQPQVKKTPVRTSRVSSILRDDFLKGFNRDKDEKSFMFVEEPEREEDAFLSGFNQILNEEKKEQAERKKRQEKLTQIRANADKRAWEDAPQNEDDEFLIGFNEVEDKPNILQNQEIHKTIGQISDYKPDITPLTSFDTSKILYSKKEKPNYKPNPNKRKGSENRQPTGARERNVRHPDSEEHSRVAKGSGGRARGNLRRSETDTEEIGRVIGGVAAAAGTGYLIYRGARLLPSLLPPLWWTIGANLAMP